MSDDGDGVVEALEFLERFGALNLERRALEQLKDLRLFTPSGEHLPWRRRILRMLVIGLYGIALAALLLAEIPTPRTLAGAALSGVVVIY